MAEADAALETTGDEAPKKGSKLGLILGVVLALVLGAGGFYAVYSGLILAPADASHAEAEAGEHEPATALGPVAFVPLEPLVISLGKGATSQHLRFRAQLEVKPGAEADVSALSPRVMDVLNSYLRAVSVADLEDPTALIDLRAQMLRRIQLVTGDGRVKDLLIMEFVLN